ncbi:MAG TPA: DUF2721 domain-containing protein [Thermoanaerobaculia bacterium]
MHLSTLIPTLQLAVGPVILISGIGLLLLGMSNRYGRTIDRTREIARECRGVPTSDRERATAQLRILMSRARLLRAAIALACVSVLLAAVLVIVLFVGELMSLEVTAPLVGGLFIACMTALLAALFLYIADVNHSLGALKLEVSDVLRCPP